MLEEKSTEVDVEVDGQKKSMRLGTRLLDAFEDAGLFISSACGGQGVCHLCRVWVDDGEGIPPASVLEKRALGDSLVSEGMRLSCQISVREGMRLRIPKVETKSERRARLRRAKEEKKR